MSVPHGAGSGAGGVPASRLRGRDSESGDAAEMEVKGLATTQNLGYSEPSPGGRGKTPEEQGLKTRLKAILC